MTIPSFHRPRPAEREDGHREPMPWISRRRTGGPYRLPGLGAWLLVIAAGRRTRYRKYPQVHGHPPF